MHRAALDLPPQVMEADFDAAERKVDIDAFGRSRPRPQRFVVPGVGTDQPLADCGIDAFDGLRLRLYRAIAGESEIRLDANKRSVAFENGALPHRKTACGWARAWATTAEKPVCW